jgi:hypothetical protein
MAIKIVIEHGNTKREIEGPFNICLNSDTAKLLFDALKERVDDEGYKYGYGWISVCEKQASIANTKPSPWEERTP